MLETGFEDDSFPGNGWEIKTTNTADPCFTWFHYPADNYLSATNWRDFIADGEHSAYLQFDLFVPRPDGSTDSAHQDEWLISPVISGARYVSFEFFIDPHLLEDGSYDEFPNDYFLKLSHDGGETWENVWNARYDMLPVNGFQRAVVCLGEDTADVRVAFAGQSNPEITEIGLYYS